MVAGLVKLWRLFKGPLQWRVLWLVHDKFIIGVSGVVVNKRNQILLLKHHFREKDSVWGLPSGYANSGETLEQTLVREVFEETGYTIQTNALLKLVSGYKLRLEVVYLARLMGGVLNINQREIAEAKFFSEDELPDHLLRSHRQLIGLAFSKIHDSPDGMKRE